MRVVAGFALATVVAAGCTYYSPLATPTPVPGTYVALALTDSGSEKLSQYLGSDVGNVRGHLIGSNDTSYVMAVDAVDLRHGLVLDWKGERVVVARPLVGAVSERRFSLGRSALVGGLSTLGLVVSFEAFKTLGAGAATGGGGGRPR